MRHIVILAAAGLLLAALPLAAQTTVGFTDPTDLDDLLDYRLPDWGWRTWDLDGQLRGEGYSLTQGNQWGENSGDRTNQAANLTSDYRYEREGEDHQLELRILGEGDWSRQRSGSGDEVNRTSFLRGYYSVHGRGRLYLAGSPWFVTGFLGSVGTWEQHSYEYRSEGWSNEHKDIRRSGGYAATGGGGLGRLRDVTPLVRALRLDERLAALGRPRLTPQQVQQIARVLATEYGYRRVFERPDRRFWRDVLEPLVGGEPLTVAEIFYLADVLDEDLSGRRQGARLQAEGMWYKGGSGDDATYETTWSLRGDVSRNLSLDHQLSAYAVGFWRTANGPWEDYHLTWVELGVAHLWNVADRLRLESEVAGVWDRYDYQDQDSTIDWYSVSATMALDIRVEDRLAVQPYLGAVWRERTSEGMYLGYERSWYWEYGISVNYRLEGILF